MCPIQFETDLTFLVFPDGTLKKNWRAFATEHASLCFRTFRTGNLSDKSL